MDYKKMYHILFNAVTDSIERLTTAQQQAEELFMQGKDPSITLLPGLDEDDE